ncbi:MAG: DMT family transporter [Mesorhizobium sp.]|nr:DMT family transporter [Mesorhizobium sp.]
MMLMLTFAWGFNQVLIKVSTEGYSPIFLTFARSTMAALLVFAWCHFRGIKLFEKDGTLIAGTIVGLLFGAEFALIFIGLDLTTVARGTLLVNTMPFWVLLGGHFFLGEKITPMRLAGVVLAFGGVALVFSDELSLPDRSALTGDLICLVAGLLWGATTIVIKMSRLATARPEKTLLYQLVVSGVMVIPLIPFGGPMLRDPDLLSTGSLLLQAAFIVAFTYLLWFWLVRRYPASGLTSFAFLSPVHGVILGGLLLNEPLSVNIFIALGLIAAGLLLVNRPARRVQPG